MKKIMVLIVALAFTAGISSTALAGTVSGEVTKVKGNEVTIEVSKSDAKGISKGDSVKMKTKSNSKKKASPGASALVGC
ncbi:MAG: selenite/tellurite reduction operon protein ExtJ [Thermodesulfobacteriota bacterium]